MKSILFLCVFCWTPGGGDGVLKGDMSDPWQDAVAYRMPDDPVTKNRVTRAGDWLKSHLESLPRPQDKFPIPVIAWKDPTLEPANPKLLAGYVITDTLWSAKALKFFDPVASLEMEKGIQPAPNKESPGPDGPFTLRGYYITFMRMPT